MFEIIKKGMVFKGFLTEKERLQSYLEEQSKHMTTDDNNESNYNTNDNKRTSNNFSSKYTHVQPQMRFKPRTELERISDAINYYSYGRVNKDLVNKQLLKLDLNLLGNGI